MINYENKNKDETSWIVEGWRGIAAWLVIYAHYWAGPQKSFPLMQFSFTGVNLFFVLSGYVFAPYFFGKEINIKSFAIKRFFRIYPAYIFALLVFIFIAYYENKQLLYIWQHLLFFHFQTREMTFYYNPVFWSLPAEVEFYIVLPLLAYFIRKKNVNLVILIIVAFVLRLSLGWQSDLQTQNPSYILVHHLPGILLEFILGICAWRLVLQGINIKTRLVLMTSGLLFWCMLAYWFSNVGDQGINATLAKGQIGWFASIAFAAMIAATASNNASVKKNQLIPFLATWGGKLSYGCYLFHIAFLNLMQNYFANLNYQQQRLIAAILTLVASWIVYKMIENPCREWGREIAKKIQ